MDTCWKCGAGISPGIEWCGRCFQRVVHVPEARDDLALQLGDIEIVHAPAPPGGLIHPGERGPAAPVRNGPPLGMVGKLAMTATIVGAGASLYSVAAVLTPSVGSATVAFIMMMVSAYSILGGFMLLSVWRDQSRPRMAGEEGQAVSFQPTHRRADDLTTPAL
jgi:hypothetical protein